MIHEPALVAVVGQLALSFGDSEELLKSPGLLRKHYSPRAKLILGSWSNDAELRQLAASHGVPPNRCHVVAHTQIPSGEAFGRVSLIPHDPEAFGRALYAELHECDQAGAELIIVEALPQRPEWRALSDRLQRAAAT
jgi:L-threonylcarbamoyladenylate synthase